MATARRRPAAIHRSIVRMERSASTVNVRRVQPTISARETAVSMVPVLPAPLPFSVPRVFSARTVNAKFPLHLLLQCPSPLMACALVMSADLEELRFVRSRIFPVSRRVPSRVSAVKVSLRRHHQYLPQIRSSAAIPVSIVHRAKAASMDSAHFYPAHPMHNVLQANNA
jgi:hypothetical protein